MSEPRAEAERAFHAGRRCRAAGDLKGALSNFLMALALDPDAPAHRRAALQALGTATGYRALPEAVIGGLKRCAQDPTLDLQPLSLVVRNLWEGDRRFAALETALAGPWAHAENHLARADCGALLSDELLQAVLARAILIGARLEGVLTRLRAHALRALARKQPGSALLSAHRPLLIALARQMQAMRFPWAESEEESAALAHLPVSADAALVTAMYRDVLELPKAPAELLPTALATLRGSALLRQQAAAALPRLTEIEAPTSRAVRDQYERYPYPPWDVVDDAPPTTVAEFARAKFPNAEFKLAAEPEILSAGCGTGRGAIMLARTFPTARVTAVDLSRTSLAYAQMKAKQLGVGNIAFAVADILKLPQTPGRFDVIESVGVLHHLADPAAGLAALVAVLKPGGLMRLALYSERARAAVIAARELIAARAIPDSDDGVRRARQLIAALPGAHPARGVMDTPEFFTLDGLHDLIFNVAEARFTPGQLRDLLDRAGLAFLGFDLVDPGVLAAYAAAHPDDPRGLDLDKWDTFEQNSPGTFAEMFQFWCRKPGA